MNEFHQLFGSPQYFLQVFVNAQGTSVWDGYSSLYLLYYLSILMFQFRIIPPRNSRRHSALRPKMVLAVRTTQMEISSLTLPTPTRSATQTSSRSQENVK